MSIIYPNVDCLINDQTSQNGLVVNISAIAPLEYDDSTGILSMTEASSTSFGYVGVNNQSFSGQKTFTNTTQSTSISTGAVIISGGCGINGNLNINGTVTANSIIYEQIDVVVSTANSTSTSSGSLIVSGGCGIAKDLYSGNLYTGNVNCVNINNTSVIDSPFLNTNVIGSLNGSSITFTNTTQSTSISTGSVIISGGCGINGNLNINGTTNIGTSQLSDSSNFNIGTTTSKKMVLYAGGIPSINAMVVLNPVSNNVTIPISTTSTDTLTGSLVVSGGEGIGGNLNVGGLIQGFANIETNNIANLTGGVMNVAGSTTITHSIGSLSGTIESISTTGVSIVATTISSSTSTGALIVAGGEGITGNLNVGGNIIFYGTTQSTSTGTGILQVIGGVGIGGNLNIGGNINAGGNEFAGGNLNITGTAGSTSTSTGAAIINGGMGIKQNLYLGGLCNINGSLQSNSIILNGTANVNINTIGLISSYHQSKTFSSTGSLLLITVSYPSATASCSGKFKLCGIDSINSASVCYECVFTYINSTLNVSAMSSTASVGSQTNLLTSTFYFTATTGNINFNVISIVSTVTWNIETNVTVMSN